MLDWSLNRALRRALRRPRARLSASLAARRRRPHRARRSFEDSTGLCSERPRESVRVPLLARAVLIPPCVCVSHSLIPLWLRPRLVVGLPVRGFPATQRETRGSPALCVSGSFQGNQRVFGAPFCFSRVSLGKLASFPESESWSGAKSGAKLRKSARYPGILQVYRGFPGIPAKYPGILPIWLILGPNQPQTRLRAREIDDFHGVSPGN